jgi:ferredoxin
MKAAIDRDGCISCGLCAQSCPEIFQMAEDELAEVILEEVPKNLENEAMDAMNNCPVSVITVE